MATWKDLLQQYSSFANDSQRSAWLHSTLVDSLGLVSQLRGDRNVLLYGTAFLQKPQVPGQTLMITFEDMNGLMSSLYGMPWDKGLTLILHTPGGVTNAAESFVEYLRSKFAKFEVIVPTFAMSAGTMISLASDVIVMGDHSQLGPIDPQFMMGGRTTSARAVVAQFEQARREVLDDARAAHLWAPVLGAIGPALLKEAENVIAYSEDMVAAWLAKYMYKDAADPTAEGKRVAHLFNEAGTMNDHGHRIGRDEAAGWGVKTEGLEDDQRLQESVLTAYHAMTLFFEQGPATKIMMTATGNAWVKNFETVEEQMLRAKAQQRQQRPSSATEADSSPLSTAADSSN